MNKLPTALISLIAEFASEPTYVLSNLGGKIDPQNLDEAEVKYLCANPHPGVSCILEPYVMLFTKEMWRILSINSGAFDLLQKYRDRIPKDVTVDWELLKEERYCDHFLEDYVEDSYTYFTLQPFGIDCETTDGLKDVNKETLEFTRYDYEDLVDHEWIIHLIEHGILNFDAFKCKHRHYIYEHPDIICETTELNKESHGALMQLFTHTLQTPHTPVYKTSYGYHLDRRFAYLLE